MEKHLNVPANTEELAELKSGDYVYLTGTIYTARDAAHKRMYETLLDGKELPVDVKGQFIYYLGPTPAREGQVIGQQDRQQAAEWINIPQRCLIKD